MPALDLALNKIRISLHENSFEDTLERIWTELEIETIDYGVMEKVMGVLTIPANDLGWHDLGGWDGLYHILEKDSDQNAIRVRDAVALDSHGNLIVQASGESVPRLITLLGVEDHILIDTEDALFLAPRDRAQDLKDVVDSLPSRDLGRYL